MIPSKVLPNIYIQLHTKYELLFTVKLYFSFILLYTACFSARSLSVHQIHCVFKVSKIFSISTERGNEVTSNKQMY